MTPPPPAPRRPGPPEPPTPPKPHTPHASTPSPAGQREQAEATFLSALERAPEERDAFLAGACAGDTALEAEVRTMLAAHRAAGDFLEQPALSPELEAELARLKPEEGGEMIGAYKLREQIGEGGFGTVWVADQEKPVRRRVALKVIKAGMDTKEVIARFEQERQALALMDHPNIAKVLDAGATKYGRPYFVMELVRGVKITRYCDDQQLSTRERIELFITICQAVQHAHQKGVIHRDLKPSNILVTVNDGAAVVKVIDFGVAKATQGRLTAATVYTQFQQMIGTPVYMSPEQAELTSLDIDTRSDIYALGVLLYELLTGRTPIDQDTLARVGLDEMRRMIREVDPPRPSARVKTLADAELTTAAKRRHTDPARLPGALSGDIDWIVMKCLEKDRKRRYDTANGLALDLQRHLQNEVITARPPTMAYLLGKLIRRNKLIFAAAGAVLAALLLGLVVSVSQAIRATRAGEAETKQRIAAETARASATDAQKKAEQEKQRAEELAVLATRAGESETKQRIAADAARASATEAQKKAEDEKRRAEEQLVRAEWLLYAGKLALAQTDFEAGQGGLAAHYLSQCPENLRGWEHRYLSARLEAKLTLTGHQSGVFSVAFSRDGKQMVTGGEDGTAKIWDTATGRLLRSIEVGKLFVWSVNFSPDGQRIVTGGEYWQGESSGEAAVWNVETGEKVFTLSGRNQSVRSATFSPDGKQIVTGTCAKAPDRGEVRFWDAETGHDVLTLPDYAEDVRSAVFSPNGERLATSTVNGQIRIWNAATKVALFTLEDPILINDVAFSPDGRRLVSVGSDLTAKIWDLETPRELFPLKGHRGWVVRVAFSPDGQRVATSSWDQTVKVWNAATGHELFALKGHRGPVRAMAFSPDGTRLATGSNDGTARLWDAINGQEVPVLKGHADAVTSIAFSSDSTRVVTGDSDNTARVWDAATRRELLKLKMHEKAPGPSWDVAGVWGVAISADGLRIATASQDRVARVWDAVTGKELHTLKHPDVVLSVAFSPDGLRLVTGGQDATARIWEIATEREVLPLTGHTGAVYAVAFSPDGKWIVTGSHDSTAKIWDATDGRERLTLQGHAGDVRGVAISSDGRRVATASADRTAKIWDATTGREELTLHGHTMQVRSVAFSPDGERLATGSLDRSAKLWETKTGLEVFSFSDLEQSVLSVAFSPNGQRFATGLDGAFGTVKIWSAGLPP